MLNFLFTILTKIEFKTLDTSISDSSDGSLGAPGTSDTFMTNRAFREFFQTGGHFSLDLINKAWHKGVEFFLYGFVNFLIYDMLYHFKFLKSPSSFTFPFSSLMTFLLTSPMRTTSFMVMVSLFSLFFFTHFFLPEFRSRNINSDNFLLLIHLFHDINIRLT